MVIAPVERRHEDAAILIPAPDADLKPVFERDRVEMQERQMLRPVRFRECRAIVHRLKDQMHVLGAELMLLDRLDGVLLLEVDERRGRAKIRRQLRRELGYCDLFFPLSRQEQSPVTDMHQMPDPNDDELDGAEAARRRDEVVRRMMATPPTPRTAPAKKGREPKPAPEA